MPFFPYIIYMQIIENILKEKMLLDEEIKIKDIINYTRNF